MMLMPPQKPMRPSTTTSLRCNRRSRVRLSLNVHNSGRYISSCTPGFQQLPAQFFRKRARPEAVDQEVHQHCTPRCANQRCGDSPPGVVGLENVGLQEDLACRGIDRALERREVLLDVAQQPDPVPAPEIHAIRVSSADSAM